MTPAEVVKSARAAARISQAELARRIKVTVTTVGRWETGLQEPSHDYLSAVAKACGQRLVLETSPARPRRDPAGGA